MTIRGIAHRRAIRGPLLPAHDDVFRFIGEDQRGGGVPNNASFDTGSARVPITRSDGIHVRRYRDRTPGVPRQGTFAALWCDVITDYAEFPYRAESSIRAGSGNAVTTGDFYIGGDVYYPSGGGPSTYPVSVQDATPTAAGTAWAFWVDATEFLNFVFSDGTTRLVMTAKTATFTAAGWYRISAERVGTRIYLACSTANSRTVTVLAEATFTAALNVPSGAVIRFNNALAAETGVNGTFWDTWQIKRHSLFGGGHYTAPVDPVPRSIAIVGPEVDPYFANVVLVFDFASSTGHGLVDLSTSPATFTNNGGVAITTADGDPFGDGLGAAGFAASTYISTNRAPASPTDICIEAYIYRTATSGVVGRIITAQTGANALITMYLNGADQIVFSTRESTGAVQTTIVGATTIPINTWTHVAGTFEGSAMTLWVGGVSDGTNTIGLDLAGAPVYEIGSIGIAAGTQFFPGSIRAGRVTEGYSRYSATFTPPAAFYQLAA